MTIAILLLLIFILFLIGKDAEVVVLGIIFFLIGYLLGELVKVIL